MPDAPTVADVTTGETQADPYTAVIPQCPCCTAAFDQTAEHKETMIDDDQLRHLVECGQCGRPWEVIIDYSELGFTGIEIWMEPDIYEHRYRHRERDPADVHATLTEFDADSPDDDPATDNDPEPTE